MIIHLDADAFFASVEQAADPCLRGKAMAVGGQTRGIVSSASYEARARGVYTPVPVTQAKRLCPELIMVRGDFAKYERFSNLMFSMAEDLSPHVEKASIDEGYVSLPGVSDENAVKQAKGLRDTIWQALRVPVSIGVGGNKLVAQIASKLEKPNGFVFVDRGKERSFLNPLRNREIPGVGPKLGKALDRVDLWTIGDIADADLSVLSRVCGSRADRLRQHAMGIDDRPVVTDRSAAKSYGHQETFGENVADKTHVLATLRQMTDDLMSKVRRDGKCIRTVSVRIRYGDMSDRQKSLTLEEPSELESDVYPVLKTLLDAAWTRREGLRLVGVALKNVCDTPQAEFSFGGSSERRGDRQRLAKVVDALREKDRSSILRGHDLWLKGKE